MKTGVAIAALAGLALAAGLIFSHDLDRIGAAFMAAGWTGIALLSAAYLASMVPCALAWRAIDPEAAAAAGNMTLLYFWARWLRDSVSDVLAVLPAAGELISARELSVRGVRPGMAGATTVVDVTLELLSQILFCFLGLGILILLRPGQTTAWWAGGALIAATALGIGFVAAQRTGLFRFLETLPERLGLNGLWRSPTEAESMHTAIQTIYAGRRRIGAGFALHFAGWVMGAAQTWVGLLVMGHAVGYDAAIVIESLVMALRNAAFMIPWAAGVQEAGYVLLGTQFGFGAETALALSLLRRARDLTLGVPCLVLWQADKGRALWRHWLGLGK